MCSSTYRNTTRNHLTLGDITAKLYNIAWRLNGANLPKMTEQELLQFIKKSLLKNKNLTVKPDTLFFREKILDSMNILDLIGYVEKHLGRRLKDEEIIMSNFQSVSAITKAFGDES